jgi:hypothetical protein
MRHAEDLDKVVRSALKQFRFIEKRLAVASLAPKAQERNVALCLLDAQSAWSLFVREFFASCFIGAKRNGGGRVTTTAPGPHTPAEAIRWATVTMNPKVAGKRHLGPLDEPRWHKPLTLPRLAQFAKLSNEPEILAAFAVRGPALDDLPKARNFYAHRSEETARKLEAIAANYSVAAAIRAGAIPAQPHPKIPGMIAETWVQQIIAMVKLLPK